MEGVMACIWRWCASPNGSRTGSLGLEPAVEGTWGGDEVVSVLRITCVGVLDLLLRLDIRFESLVGKEGAAIFSESAIDKEDVVDWGILRTLEGDREEDS